MTDDHQLIKLITKMKHPAVYILASGKNGTFYIGVTSNLPKRIYEHKQKLVAGFTKKYGVDKLVYFEDQGNIEAAITREKQLKKWNRAWKIELIEKDNPSWKDLYPEICG
jgi:putative endonuclease